MAANTFASGTTDETVVFPRAVNYLNVFVAASVTFSLSVDKGENFISLPAGFHSFFVGPITEVQVQSTGAWQLIGVQA